MAASLLHLLPTGQFAGRRVAQALVEAFDVVMVDAKPAFEYTPSLLRCLVEPAHAHNIIVPHAASVEGPRVVVGAVHTVDAAGAMWRMLQLVDRVLCHTSACRSTTYILTNQRARRAVLMHVVSLCKNLRRDCSYSPVF